MVFNFISSYAVPYLLSLFRDTFYVSIYPILRYIGHILWEITDDAFHSIPFLLLLLCNVMSLFTTIFICLPHSLDHSLSEFLCTKMHIFTFAICCFAFISTFFLFPFYNSYTFYSRIVSRQLELVIVDFSSLDVSERLLMLSDLIFFLTVF